MLVKPNSSPTDDGISPVPQINIELRLLGLILRIEPTDARKVKYNKVVALGTWAGTAGLLLNLKNVTC